MAVQRVAILNEERMQKLKTLLLTKATRSDRWRIDDTWHTMQDSPWEHNQTVDEITHFGRHHTSTGDILIAERVDGTPIAHLQVLSMAMANTDDLTQPDYDALGYVSREDFSLDWGELLGGKVWRFKVERITPRADYSEVL
jgi:hypothetical protein